MNIEKLVPIAIAAAIFTTTSTGSLLNAINFIRRAEILLIQDSKASKWSKAPMLKKQEDHKIRKIKSVD